MYQLISKDRFYSITKEFQTCGPILVVGDVGIDKYTLGEVRRISPEAPVPVLEVTKEWPKLGLAANISHNLTTLGVSSTLCGVVGDDMRANLFESLLEDEGLKTWGIVRDKTRPTIYKERVSTKTQQICRIDYEETGPINLETENRLIKRVKEFSKDFGALILEDYAKGTLTKKVITDLIDQFNAEKKIIAIDPGRDTDPLFYRNATLLKPNLKESQLMAHALGYNEKKLTDIIDLFVDKLNIKMVVITLGAEGMAVFDRDCHQVPQIIPTVANEVFDVSGAGDTAISVLTASLLSGASLIEAAWIGNCASGVVVGKTGTATVNLAELNEFYERLQLKLKQ